MIPIGKGYPGECVHVHTSPSELQAILNDERVLFAISTCAFESDLNCCQDTTSACTSANTGAAVSPIPLLLMLRDWSVVFFIRALKIGCAPSSPSLHLGGGGMVRMERGRGALLV